MKEVTSYISLGSNLAGNAPSPKQNLDSAIKSLNDERDITVVKCSSYYLSKAIGQDGQPDYTNGVIKIASILSPTELLDTLNRIEEQHGRDRSKELRWGPRTLDLDILIYGNKTIKTNQLQIPHKEIHNRNFVLLPLLEIAPELTLPDGNSIQSLAEKSGQNGIIKL